jgi:arsenate reductase (thioredoxin)
MIRQSTHRVNMGCVDKNSCPTLFLHNVIDWDIEDPKGKSVEKVREIRDVIEFKVKELVTNLNQTNQQVNT